MNRDCEVSALVMLDTIEVNVNNMNLSDEAFRQFVNNSLTGLRERFEQQAMRRTGGHFKEIPKRFLDLARL